MVEEGLRVFILSLNYQKAFHKNWGGLSSNCFRLVFYNHILKICPKSPLLLYSPSLLLNCNIKEQRWATKDSKELIIKNYQRFFLGKRKAAAYFSKQRPKIIGFFTKIVPSLSDLLTYISEKFSRFPVHTPASPASSSSWPPAGSISFFLPPALLDTPAGFEWLHLQWQTGHQARDAGRHKHQQLLQG